MGDGRVAGCVGAGVGLGSDVYVAVSTGVLEIVGVWTGVTVGDGDTRVDITTVMEPEDESVDGRSAVGVGVRAQSVWNSGLSCMICVSTLSKVLSSQRFSCTNCVFRSNNSNRAQTIALTRTKRSRTERFLALSRTRLANSVALLRTSNLFI